MFGLFELPYGFIERISYDVFSVKFPRKLLASIHVPLALEVPISRVDAPLNKTI